MLVRIQRNQVHHFKEEVFDDEGNPTGEEKDVLQFNLQFSEYPDLPTFPMRVDFPLDKQKVLNAIRAKAQEAMTRYNKDEAVRDAIDNLIEPSNPSGFYEFNITL